MVETSDVWKATSYGVLGLSSFRGISIGVAVHGADSDRRAAHITEKME